MKRILLPAAIVLSFCALHLSCRAQAQAEGGQSFEFSSGGAYHISGLGEWKVRLDRQGAFSVQHDISGAVTDLGTHSLTPRENTETWDLIRAAQLDTMESSQRMGVPDEAQYVFTLGDGAKARSIKLWANDASRNAKIMALLDRLAALIETYTKEKPVLK